MPRALILGAGQIGHAVAGALIGEGWSVTIGSRHPAAVPKGARHVALDASDEAALSREVGGTTDLLLSCVAYDAADGERLARIGRAAGRVVAISSISVFRDAGGRTLDEARKTGFPFFDVPIDESNPVVAPGPATYSTRKVAMEQALIAHAASPVTILRPGAIHGPVTRNAREWWFVKRLLDGRETIPLAYRGQSRFQTTATAAIATATLRAAAGELPTIANVTDADCPTVAEIGQAIMAVMGRSARLVGLPEADTYPPAAGMTPWSLAQPMICAGAGASDVSYAEAVAPAVEWLVDHVSPTAWRDQLPMLAAYPYDLFDYAADDRALATDGARPIGG